MRIRVTLKSTVQASGKRVEAPAQIQVFEAGCLDKADPSCVFRPLHTKILTRLPASTKLTCIDIAHTNAETYARAISAKSYAFRAGVIASAITAAFFLLTCATIMG